MSANNPIEGRVSVRSFRQIIRRRHRDEHLITDSGADRTELIFNLSRVMNRLGQDFEALHRRSGISWSGFRLMNVIWAVDDAEVREVTRLSGATRASTWSLLNTLENRKLVERTRDTRDKRMVRVRLTDFGRSELSRAIQAQAARDEQWLAVLTPDQQSELRHLLELVADQKPPQ